MTVSIKYRIKRVFWLNANHYFRFADKDTNFLDKKQTFCSFLYIKGVKCVQNVVKPLSHDTFLTRHLLCEHPRSKSYCLTPRMCIKRRRGGGAGVKILLSYVITILIVLTAIVLNTGRCFEGNLFLCLNLNLLACLRIETSARCLLLN